MTREKGKFKRNPIKLKNGYFELVNTRLFQALIAKEVFEETKPRYWLGRALDKVHQESKHYFDAKQEIVKKYALKHTEDGEELVQGKVVRKWKKDDPVTFSGGVPEWDDFDGFTKELAELQDIEIELDMNRVKFETYPNVTVQENTFLNPLLEEKENQDE